jgi:hypothetical protein
LPIVQSVPLIDVDDQGAMPPQVDLASRNIHLLSAHEATDEVNVIIETGPALDVQWLDLMRARQEGGLLLLWSAIRRSRGAHCLQQAGPRGAARPLRRNLASADGRGIRSDDTNAALFMKRRLSGIRISLNGACRKSLS